MIQIAPTHRAFLGGMVAGLIGVAVFAGAKASADPLFPAPAPAPAVPAPAPAPQNVMAVPGQVPNSRFLATPPQSNPFAPPVPATSPGAPGPAVTPAAPMPPTLTPAVSGTLREYLQSKGVKLVAQKPQGFDALDITLPVPTRWTQVPDPNVPDAFAVIADRHGNSVYTSNAQVVVYKLVGNFDPKEAITHGYVDSQKLLAWQPTNASMADFGDFPSSVVEGTYRDGDMMLNTSRRHVIATSGRDKYLVSLSVTTDRSQAVADAPATNGIINGFRVSAPGAAPAPAQGPAAAPVGLLGQTPGTAPVGLPAQAPVPNQMAAPQPAPNLSALVPGLPPLPNFSFLQH
ncbi:MAG TPA: LpqN/LpqT family lipoprotein [Mycobacterium sp.]|nr:LpqN/LpqT family lipoprotein [Mycobacterium sp.]HUH71195.1 LpqN/LpqT family lipoprotein [Mycobacterium sp.]